MKIKWHVPDFSGSGNQKAANVRFCISFNKLFWVSVTQGKCMLQKGQAGRQERSEKKAQGKKQPRY